MRTAWGSLRGADLSEQVSRVFLASLAVVSIILAAGESHEAIGSAMVGAAVAFALGAAFFDRVIELSPRGMKLREQLKRLDEVAERELEGADPEERQEVVEEGRDILVSRRSEGEPVSPDSALKEAQVSWVYNGFAAEIRFANWLISQGWTVSQEDRFIAVRRPDLVAEKDGQRIVVEVKVGRRPLGIVVIDQLLALATSVEAVAPHELDGGERTPVLVVRGVRLTRAAIESARQSGVSVYEIDDSGEIHHFLGPELS